MQLPKIKAVLLRLLALLLVLVLAGFWIMLFAKPAFAQANTINYSNTHLEGRDFSNTDLVGRFVPVHGSYPL